MRSVTLLLLCWLFGTGVAQAGKIYKWIDTDGQIHYGDRPQAFENEEIKVRRAPKNSAVAAPPVSPEQPAGAEQQQEPYLSPDERKQRCNDAQLRLKRYREAAYLYSVDAEGKRTILPDSQRQSRLDAEQKEVDRLCR